MLKALILLLPLTLSFTACDKKKEQTTPKQESTAEEDDSPKAPAVDKGVPGEFEERVAMIWQSGFNAVRNCVSTAIQKSGQKGIKGYIHVQARIGLQTKPIDLKIVKKTLKVEGIESCIVDYLKDLEFPTWGYNVKYLHSYDMQIGY